MPEDKKITWRASFARLYHVLQNRCSTAELNRLTPRDFDDPSDGPKNVALAAAVDLAFAGAPSNTGLVG